MISAIASFLKDVLTTRDGVSFDVIRVGMVASGAAFIGLAAYDVIINKQPFHGLEFGPGVAAIFAGGGWGIAKKKVDEPE